MPFRRGGGAPAGANTVPANSTQPLGNFNDAGLLDTVWTYRQANPNVPVIYVLFSGRPIGVANPENLTANPGQHVNNWDAFVWAGLPGSEGGNAVLDVLFRAGGHDGVFFGKSPYTWRSNFVKPEWQNNLYAPDSVVFPYGHGINVPLD